MDLSGQTILVTGSEQGIGRAIVEELATRDATCSAACATPTTSSSCRAARLVW